jgi:hypothetical protein
MTRPIGEELFRKLRAGKRLRISEYRLAQTICLYVPPKQRPRKKAD